MQNLINQEKTGSLISKIDFEKLNPTAAIVLVALMAFSAICRMNGGS